MPAYNGRFRVVYKPNGDIIEVNRGGASEIVTSNPCAEFSTASELDAFIVAQGLAWPETTL